MCNYILYTITDAQNCDTLLCYIFSSYVIQYTGAIEIKNVYARLNYSKESPN